jgi:hypothetical protein
MPLARNHERRRLWRQPEFRYALAILVVLALAALWLASVFG